MDYAAAHREAGVAPDLAPYLERVPEADRSTLARRIEELLVSEPRRKWDPAAFEATLNSSLMREIETSVRGASGLWPALLPRLRNSAHLKRREVVQRLAGELQVSDREEKVGRYYHEMEQGLLDERGVSETVLDALARILGSSADALREAGRALGPPSLGGRDAPSPVYARTAIPDSAYAPADQPAPADGSPEAWDEVDELFAGRRD